MSQVGVLEFPVGAKKNTQRAMAGKITSLRIQLESKKALTKIEACALTMIQDFEAHAKIEVCNYRTEFSNDIVNETFTMICKAINHSNE